MTRKRQLLLILLMVAVGFGALAGTNAGVAQDGPPTGDEILAKAAEKSSFVREGSRISIIEFDILFPDGTTQTRKFAFFGKRDETGEKLLIYFLEPELECGTIFLS